MRKIDKRGAEMTVTTIVVIVFPLMRFLSFVWLPFCETNKNPNSRQRILTTCLPEKVFATPYTSIEVTKGASFESTFLLMGESSR